MRAHRQGTNLRIEINLALHSLGRNWKGATKGLTIAQMKTMLAKLRHEQIEHDILKVKVE